MFLIFIHHHNLCFTSFFFFLFKFRWNIRCSRYLCNRNNNDSSVFRVFFYFVCVATKLLFLCVKANNKKQELEFLIGSLHNIYIFNISSRRRENQEHTNNHSFLLLIFSSVFFEHTHTHTMKISTNSKLCLIYLNFCILFNLMAIMRFVLFYLK